MKIRKATKKDLKEIGKLMLEEFSKQPFNEKNKLDDVLKSLNFYFKIGKIYIAVNEEEIIGVLIFKIEQYWEGKVLIIEDLAVREDFKNQGVGKSLMEFILGFAKNKNIKRILFETNKKSPSVNFYKKIGYSEYKNRISMGKKIK